ncbi:MAG TPA: YihY/virulence factor BrkB family protein [Jiangellaceae bacterium]|nr:YihY/virulence factor BrkB family protein [Jiangellaceae bacterium]
MGRITRWADDLQRRHAFLGFPYAVIKKYGDDAGVRHAALITYFGFLSIFPAMLLVVAVTSRLLQANPSLRDDLIDEVVPEQFQDVVDEGLASIPDRGWPYVVGVIGLLYAGTGVVSSAYVTLNHLIGIRYRDRRGFIARYAYNALVLLVVLAGAVAGAGTGLLVAALPGAGLVERSASILGTFAVLFAVLIVAARLLIVRRVSIRATWPAAALGALLTTAVISVGSSLVARSAAGAGAVYGSFAAVVGIFAVLYFVSQALVFSAETAVVLHRGLWPRALDRARPTAADVRVLTMLAREQERVPGQRIDVRVAEVVH